MADKAKSWKSVWITGASSGIGLELARLFEGRAGYIAISARSADKLATLESTYLGFAAHPVDVSDERAVRQCVAAIEAEGGCPDLAILNAGIWHMMDAHALDAATVRRAVEINYLGVVNAVAALLPAMLARGSGHIAIVASVAGYRGLPRAACYGPTKAALINLAETLHSELASRGITVSLINPGFVDTPMTAPNPFPMPGLMPARDAAQLIMQGLERARYEISFPRRLVWPMKLLRLLPDAVYFWLVRSALSRG